MRKSGDICSNSKIIYLGRTSHDFIESQTHLRSRKGFSEATCIQWAFKEWLSREVSYPLRTKEAVSSKELI